MPAELMVLLMFVVLLGMLAIGVPLAYSLGASALLFGYIHMGSTCLNMFAGRAYDLVTNYIMVAVPLFVLMANFLEASGLAERLFEGFRMLFGTLRGGLAIGTVVVCTLFAASTGIIGAAVVTMSLIAVPSMHKYGYAKDLETGVTCASGTLGILIPPSIMLVVYGSLSGLSVGKLFAAAIFPGLMLSALYILYIIIRCLVRPQDGPAMSKDEIASIPLSKRLFIAFSGVGPTLLLIGSVLGSIFFGIATPTEAAAVGSFIGLIFMICYRKFTLKALRKVVLDTLKTSCMVDLIMILAGCFTSVFMSIGGGRVITNFMLGSGFTPALVLFFMLFLVFILGMFLDWMGILLICAPLFMPIAAQLGYNQLWFGTLICVCLQTAFITPPFAYAIFFVRAVAPKGVTTVDIYKGVLPFIGLQCICLYLLILFPQIILWLPGKIA